MCIRDRDFTTDLRWPPTRPLRPVNPNNACSPRITAAAGTELVGDYKQYRDSERCYLSLIRPVLAKFTSRGISSFTRRCWVRLSHIAQNSRLLPPVGV